MVKAELPATSISLRANQIDRNLNHENQGMNMIKSLLAAHAAMLPDTILHFCVSNHESATIIVEFVTDVMLLSAHGAVM